MWKRLLALVLTGLAVAGCVVEVVSGPTEVEIGTFVEYVVRIENQTPLIGSSMILGVLAFVPSEWDLVDVTYVADLGGGMTAEGTGLLDTYPYTQGCGWPWPDGYRRVSTARPFTITSGKEVALVTLRFYAGGHTGAYELAFRTYHDEGSGGCSDPATISIRQAPIPPVTVPVANAGGLVVLALALVAGGVFVMARNG